MIIDRRTFLGNLGHDGPGGRAAAPARVGRAGRAGHLVRGPAPRRGHLQRAGRHDRVADQRRRHRRRRQPERRSSGGLHRRHPRALRPGHRPADQHASSRRPHGRQTRPSGRSSARSWPTENSADWQRQTSEQTGSADPFPDVTFTDVWETNRRRRDDRGPPPRRGAHERRRRPDVPAGQRRAHGRPDVQPPAPLRGSVVGGADRGLDRHAGTGGRRARRRHHLCLRARQPRRRRDRDRGGPQPPRATTSAPRSS